MFRKSSLLIIILPQLIFTIVPVAIFHGQFDSCQNLNTSLVKLLENKLESTDIKCFESGEYMQTLVGVSLLSQAEQACERLKKDVKFNGKDIQILGLDQGGLIGRYITTKCDFGGTVKKLISVGAANMGITMMPRFDFKNSLCKYADQLKGTEIYSKQAQQLVGPAGQYRDQYNLQSYRDSNSFLAMLNNEKKVDTKIKNRMINLEKLVLVMFDKDTQIVPKESAIFGSFKENSDELLTLQETESYKQDLLGLKTLDDQGKLITAVVQGDHMQWSSESLQTHIVDQLKDL